MKSTLTGLFVIALVFASGCSTTDRFAEFRRYEKEANGRFLGVLGFALAVPGVEDFERNYSYAKDVFVIPKTSDSFQSQEELDYNRRAEEFARLYNRQILKQKKKEPNQALEPTSTAVTPPASAGDRASGARGSP
jgi:hypothetical protein